MGKGKQNWLRRLWWSGGGKDLPILTVLDNRTQPIPGHAGAGDWEPGQEWVDPRKWLEEALRKEGKDPREEIARTGRTDLDHVLNRITNEFTKTR